MKGSSNGTARVCIAFPVFAALLLTGSACQESLPPYRTPSEVFTLALRADQPDLHAVHRDLDDISMGKGGLGFSMDLRNVFDETLADTVREPLGELQIWSRDEPSVFMTIVLNRSDEIMTHAIQWDGFLIFSPGDSLRLAEVCRTWLDDRGRPVWTLAGEPVSENGRIRYPPVDMAARAWVQPFDRAPAVYSNTVLFRMFFSREAE
ncbi:hypothetical protein JW777_04070 [bacterium]|nr:hypothetical protein [bacterium]